MDYSIKSLISLHTNLIFFNFLPTSTSYNFIYLSKCGDFVDILSLLAMMKEAPCFENIINSYILLFLLALHKELM